MGFLSYLGVELPNPRGGRAIPFDREMFDPSNNYNRRTGVFTVPYNGYYLIRARLEGRSGDARHSIRVGGRKISRTEGTDPEEVHQAAATSMVLYLKRGEEVTVCPEYHNTYIVGNTCYATTSFGAVLLYPDDEQPTRTPFSC